MKNTSFLLLLILMFGCKPSPGKYTCNESNRFLLNEMLKDSYYLKAKLLIENKELSLKIIDFIHKDSLALIENAVIVQDEKPLEHWQSIDLKEIGDILCDKLQNDSSFTIVSQLYNDGKYSLDLNH